MDIKLYTVIFTVYHVSLWIETHTEEMWENNGYHSYYLAPEKINWTDAKTACERRDAKLSIVPTNDEQTFLRRMATSILWIGLIRGDLICQCNGGASAADCDRCRMSWKWYDGTPMTDYRWSDNRPWGEGRACGVIRDTGFDASKCSNLRYSYTCSRSCEPLECKRTSCMFTNGEYSCTCDVGYTGTHCDSEIDECLSSPCLNGASCTDMLTGFICTCTSGYTGVLCETDIDECMSNPCVNNATCSNLPNRYNCICQLGYTGDNCESEIDECSSNPCVHGNCTDLIGRYSCACQSGYTGTNCERAAKVDKKSWVDDLNETALKISLGVGVVCVIVTLTGLIITSVLYYRSSKTWDKNKPSMRKGRNDYDFDEDGYVNVKTDNAQGACEY